MAKTISNLEINPKEGGTPARDIKILSKLTVKRGEVVSE